MNQYKHNLFNLSHKGLRHMLFDAMLRIQTADFSAFVSASPVLTHIEQVMLLFEENIRNEVTYVFPPVRRYNSRATEELELEHEDSRRRMLGITDELIAWKVAEGAVARLNAGRKISNRFSEFIACSLHYLDRVEQTVNAVLWKHYSDMEIIGLAQRVIQSTSPGVLVEKLRWIMRSINAREAIDWLMSIKITAPAEVFRLYLKLAHEEMPPDRWLKVKDSLFDETLITQNLN